MGGREWVARAATAVLMVVSGVAAFTLTRDEPASGADTVLAAPAVAVVSEPVGPPAPDPGTTVAPAAAPAPGCHQGYAGTCIPEAVGDADCFGAGENGPWFVRETNVRVLGADVFALDVDFDGVACEGHPGLH